MNDSRRTLNFSYNVFISNFFSWYILIKWYNIFIYFTLSKTIA